MRHPYIIIGQFWDLESFTLRARVSLFRKSFIIAGSIVQTYRSELNFRIVSLRSPFRSISLQLCDCHGVYIVQ